MSYVQLLYTVPEELRKLYRTYESLEKKLINNKWSLEFNSICIKENILPNYSRIRHHDPAVATTNTTLEYRRYLINREISIKKQDQESLRSKKVQCEQEINNFEYDTKCKDRVRNHLDTILQNSDTVAKTRMIKKLNVLYQGKTRINMESGKGVFIKENIDCFMNLSDYELTEDEKQFLNLGLNCHLEPKYDKLHKKVELEVLYQNLLNLQTRDIITINPKLADHLRCESTKHRYVKRKALLLTTKLKNAANNLKRNEDIIIRKADKSSMYVILNKEDYLTKIDSLLSDSTKFKLIKRNPTEKLKQDANKLIEALNAAQGDLKIPKIIGDFQPGYIYGSVKTHKKGNPLRPIISQIPTPTYNLAKKLNQIISPYTPDQFCLKSSNDFIDLLQASKHEGIIASLDVESLFTNVPLDDTIDIILQEVYNHQHLPPPKIPPYILGELLKLCTKEAPFRCPRGKLYLQVEGVAMGSPLGPTFANYYMGNLEKRIFNDPKNKPSIYARYVDDTFIQIENEEELIKLRNTFQINSKLKFTYELSADGKLPFLDILVKPNGDTFNTKVYHKPTDNGNCLNGDSECVERYKISVITSYLNRAFKASNTWKDFHNEILHIKQRLINNNYTNIMVDREIKKFLTQKKSLENKEKSSSTPLYYESQMHINYKIEERVIKNMIYEHTKCTDPNNKLNLIFYYKNKKNKPISYEK